jgi:phosphoglycolate phosphatase
MTDGPPDALAPVGPAGPIPNLPWTPQLVVFDLDGTLVDSRRDIAESANALLAECGCTPLHEEAVGRMVGDGAAVLIARAFAAAGCPQPPDALERFLVLYDARLLIHSRAYEGIAETLTSITSTTPVAVLTNKPLHATRQVLDGLGLAQFFPASRVLGGDGPFPRKPDPKGLLDLAAGTDVAAERTLLVGDSIVDCRTARAAGSRFCLARYGFGAEAFPAATLTALDDVIDAPIDLLKVLTRRAVGA